MPVPREFASIIRRCLFRCAHFRTMTTPTNLPMHPSRRAGRFDNGRSLVATGWSVPLFDLNRCVSVRD
mgnify:FL=1